MQINEPKSMKLLMENFWDLGLVGPIYSRNHKCSSKIEIQKQIPGIIIIYNTTSTDCILSCIFGSHKSAKMAYLSITLTNWVFSVRVQ